MKERLKDRKFCYPKSLNFLRPFFCKKYVRIWRLDENIGIIKGEWGAHPTLKASLETLSIPTNVFVYIQKLGDHTKNISLIYKISIEIYF